MSISPWGWRWPGRSVRATNLAARQTPPLLGPILLGSSSCSSWCLSLQRQDSSSLVNFRTQRRGWPAKTKCEQKKVPRTGGCCQTLAKVPWQRYSFMVSLTHAKRSSRLKSWSCLWNFSPLRHPILRELIPRISNPAICLTAGMANCAYVNSNVLSNVRKWLECQSSLKGSPASKQLDPGSTLDSTSKHLWKHAFQAVQTIYLCLCHCSTNLGVLPVRWARSHTASAEDALIHPIQLGPILASMSVHTRHLSASHPVHKFKKCQKVLCNKKVWSNDIEGYNIKWL